MGRNKILFVYTNFSSFVAQDHEILTSAYEVHQYRFRAIKGLAGTGLEILKQIFFLIRNIRKYQAVYIWFADYHSLLPVLFAGMFRKKSFVVVGGYDVNYLKEYNYGSYNKPVRKFFAKTTLRMATVCFPVAVDLENKIKLISPSSKVEVFPTIFDSQRFNFTESEREKTVLTVASTGNRQRAMIKGLDRFRELAVKMPDYEFTIIGVDESFRYFFDPIPVNLRLLAAVLHHELPQYYKLASFYAQFSRSEGLPNSLCEAMLCGCIPLGTDVGDIRPAIESTGLVVNEWMVEPVAEFIRKNHNDTKLRKNSRERIIEKYDPEIRKERLTHLF